MSRLLIKICGLTNEGDLKFCQEQGIDLTGFIFHPLSPRYVHPKFVGSWIKKNELRVGVFVDEKPERIMEAINIAGLDLVQLHGDQSPETCALIGPERVIRTFWPERFASVQDFMAELEAFKDVCRYFLFDAGKSMGGHGRSIMSPWLKKVVSPRYYLLAGGLGPENIEKVTHMDMAGLDLNSGVEKNPGQKDPQKIEKVLDIIRRQK
jgi:phosphoribosylanthranilate isomerase